MDSGKHRPNHNKESYAYEQWISGKHHAKFTSYILILATFPTEARFTTDVTSFGNFSMPATRDGCTDVRDILYSESKLLPYVSPSLEGSASG
jgi:hypothetical protein